MSAVYIWDAVAFFLPILNRNRETPARKGNDMRFCSIGRKEERAAAVARGNRIITFKEISTLTGLRLPAQLDATNLPDQAVLEPALARLKSDVGRPSDEVRYSPPFSNPSKILGIGLNYREHAADLGAQQPTEPASFMKPKTAIIGPRDDIILPKMSSRVTAEAELGVIIGKRCRHVREEEAESVVFGYVPILDMTAEDILQRNPRFLTRSKSFDTFLSFGPLILTPNEINDLPNLTISTVLNGEVIRSNQVRNMLFSPKKLIAFESEVMTWEPGDILSTGTPGAVSIKDGDIAECRIDGFPTLTNPVRSE